MHIFSKQKHFIFPNSEFRISNLFPRIPNFYLSLIPSPLSLLVCVLVPLLCSCHLIKRYQGPCAPVPHEWKNDSKDNSTLETCKKDLANWWEVFDDPVLNYLEEYALDANNNLWAALERVMEARALALEKKASLYPQVNFAPSVTRYGMLFFNPMSSAIGNSGGGASSSGSSAAPANNANAANLLNSIPSIFRYTQSQYQLPFNMSYELDLWSKLQSTYDAAIYRFQASVEDYRNVYLTMTADIATNYFLMRDLDAQQEILQRTIKARKKAFDINSQRYEAGIIADLDVANADVELQRAESDSINIRRQRALQENIIATLIGTPASVFSLEFNPLYEAPPLIPTILPSELLQRRPDIAAAERNLAAAYADIEVAYTAFYPSVNLNATLGLQSPVAHLLFDWKARLWEVGVSALQTVFDGGRNTANLDYYKARFREAYANYEQAVLTAFQDVEDALVNIREKAAQNEALARAVKAASKSLDLSQQRYDQGLINYLNVVDAERTLLEVEQNSLNVLGERYTGTINLIRALGGSWSTHDCKASP
jgi:outer membrane protein, multidrug efflux system